MEAGRNPNLLKLDVRSVEMFLQKSLISNQEAPRARSDDGFKNTKTNPDDVQIRGRGRGGGGHPHPEISRGEVVSKKFFGPQFGLKM